MKLRYPLLLLVLACLAGYNLNAQTTPDPGTAGAYAVSKDTFNLGDLAYKPDSFPNYVELRGSVHYPTSLAGGPFPVIVLLHGRHSTVYKTSAPGTTGLAWPPPVGYESIISFDGYDYFARTMASHGYIVISVSCNAINAADNSLTDRGMNARGQLMQKHLDLWNGYNTTGGAPFGTKFVGKLDMKRIGTMGHSRGGEGVIFHALLNKSLGSPYGIKAVITLAPVDFQRKILNGIPIMNIAPYCDGDVVALNGVHYYDDARYNDPADDAPKYSVLIMGANHNFFNTVWTPGSYIAGTSDDWDSNFGSTADPFCASKRAGNGRLDTTRQKAAFNAYGAAFFRMYVGGDTSFAPILQLDDLIPPVSSKLDTNDVYVSYHPAKSRRLDINRIDTLTNSSVNTLSGAVNASGLVSSALCGGGFTMPACAISTSATKEPHKGTTTVRGLGQQNLNWDNPTDYYQNEIPNAYKNFTSYHSLQFRACVNYKESTAGKFLNFTVQLIDSNGKTSSQTVSANSNALFYQPGTQTSILPKAMFNTVKIPLIRFKGVNQTKIKYVRFLFDTVKSGALLVSDIALSGSVLPCGSMINASFTEAIGSAYKTDFTDKTIVNSGDSLSWSWTFGDPASGLKDTSTTQHPTHYFSAAGTYKVCLFITVYRSTGMICRDTFCKNVTLLPNGIGAQFVNPVSIVPNPAKDMIIISGAPTDAVFELRNTLGQTVLTETVLQSAIVFPPTLPSGMYYAEIRSGTGRQIQKLIIAR